MDNTMKSEVKNVVLEKKLENYYFEEKNFSAPGELMITITLKEYRELVQKVATSDERIKVADNDKYERNKENESLKKEVEELKSKLYEISIKPGKDEEKM